MVESLVRVHNGQVFVMAKVPEDCSVSKAKKALRQNGKLHDPRFKLKLGPIMDLHGRISMVGIWDEIREEGDLDHFLVFGIGELRSTKPPSQEDR